MAVYVLLSRVPPERKTLPERTKELQEQVKQLCPQVNWVCSEEFSGPYDYIDILEAPDDLTVSRVATIVRSWRAATGLRWSIFPQQCGVRASLRLFSRDRTMTGRPTPRWPSA